MMSQDSNGYKYCKWWTTDEVGEYSFRVVSVTLLVEGDTTFVEDKDAFMMVATRTL